MLNQVKVGDTIITSGPTGNFYRVPCVHGKRLVFIAGGSGITPFLSMLQTDYEKQDTILGNLKLWESLDAVYEKKWKYRRSVTYPIGDITLSI